MGKCAKAKAKAKAKEGVRVRTRGKTSPKRGFLSSPAASSAGSNTLKRSFENSKEKEKQNGEAEVSKGMQSGFITYVKWCCRASQAAAILTKYQKLNPTEKKQMIQSFYSHGAKQGLTTLFQQSLSVEEQIGGGSWSGYVTPSKLFTLRGVRGILVMGELMFGAVFGLPKSLLFLS